MLRAEIPDYLAKWRLELDGAPFETHSSRLAYVKHGDTRAVLKILKNPESDERLGAAILMQWGGPAARVLEHDDGALLIERAMPGNTLADVVASGRDDEATNIWCDVVEQLHTAPAPPDWPTVEQRGRSFLRPPAHPLLPMDLITRARDEYFALRATQSQRRYLLHGDLNHFNILKDFNRGWIVIDPKGAVGELEWETATFLRNPTPHARMEDRVRILGARLGLDENRIVRWCASQAVLSCLWLVEDHGDQAELEDALTVARTADALLK